MRVFSAGPIVSSGDFDSGVLGLVWSSAASDLGELGLAIGVKTGGSGTAAFGMSLVGDELGTGRSVFGDPL